MTHPVEVRTWNILLEALKYCDPARRGWFVDAGAGQDTFYFEWLHNHGWRGVVVEPFPTQQVRDLCSGYGLHLAQCALWTDNRVSPIYLYQDGINALQPIWRGEPQKAIIQRRTLSAILNNLPEKPPAISLLKMDIEGAEPYVINAINGIREDWYPWIVMFEYGGQTTARTRLGAWAQSQTDRVFKAVRSLYKNDAKQLVVVGENALTRNRVITLTGGMLCRNNEYMFDLLFEDTDTWGNIIALPEIFPAEKIVEWAAREPQYS